MRSIKSLLKTNLIIGLILILGGCSLLTPKTIIETKIIEKNIPIVERPAATNLNKNIVFRLFCKYEYDAKETCKKSLKSEKELVELLEKEEAIIVITFKDYEKLALNMGDIVKYLKEQERIIIYYEDSIKRPTNEK